MFQNTAQIIVDGLVRLSDALYPLMFLGFGFTLLFKGLVIYTINRQAWFAREFEKRVMRFTEKVDVKQKLSFFVVAKRLLERTYYELFEVRGIMMRRKLDFVSSPIDRLFAIQHGCAWTVKDTLKEVRYLKYNGDNPRFIDVSKTVNNGNPCFSRLFGWLSLGPLNSLLNIVPGLFIIAGIFGTFLGIMQALPDLAHLDLKDPEGSKIVMDTFLLKISFSIGTSILGIIFSVLLTIFYSMVGIEKKYIRIVDSYDRCLNRVWDCCNNNEIPSNIKAFDEHQDPVDALASLAVDKELSGSPHNDRYDYKVSETSPDELLDSNKKAS